MKLKEYKTPKESFLGGWFIPEKICDDLISYYDEFKDKTIQGVCGNGEIKKSTKDSTDLTIHSDNWDKEIENYRAYLQQVLDLYIKRYPEVDKYDHFNVQAANIQKYKPNGGFKEWHCERSTKELSTRVLVFMTYLNNVKDGGTKFKYQKIITPAKKGLTLIWPTDFTHTHVSQIVNKEKMIITGWFSIQ